MEVVVADVTVAAKPLNFTVFPDIVLSKLEPLTVTETPANPDEGEMVVITGAGTGLFFLQPCKAGRAATVIKSK